MWKVYNDDGERNFYQKNLTWAFDLGQIKTIFIVYVSSGNMSSTEH